MKKALKIALLIALAAVVSGYGTFKYQNRKHGPDVWAMYQQQDPAPVGKTGIFVIGLSTPEDFEPSWWYNIFSHIAHARIPWPMRNLAMADRGIALMDPNRDYAREEFEPTSLVDRLGRDRDMDSIPYIEKWRRGEVEWVPPRESIHLDTGYWLYTGRNDGIPTTAGKTIGYARLWYWGRGIEGSKIPAEYQQQKVYDMAFGQLARKYPEVLYHQADTMDKYEWRTEIFDLLDRGVETIVLSSPMVVYSDYEDFDNGFRHSVEFIEEWVRANGRDVKIIVAPPMGHFKPIRDGYLAMLRDKLDTLDPGVSVKMVWSVHGMPWRAMPNEHWLEMAPAYRDKLVEESQELLSGYDFSRTEVVVSQDHFADHYWDPEGESLATNKAYLDGVDDGFDHVLNLPIEFYNENTDTLFYHAMVNYENFPGYSVYNVIDYPKQKWDMPYTKHFEIDGTQIDYLGVPVGKRYSPYVARAMFASWDSVLSRGTHLLAENRSADLDSASAGKLSAPVN